MAINEEHRQLEIARELEETARTLVHSTRTVPTPSESYDLIAELRSTISSLSQVSRQLARWSTSTTDGIHYLGDEESSGTTNPVIESAKALKAAATALDGTYTYLDHAQGQNGRVRWYGTVKNADRDIAAQNLNSRSQRSNADVEHQKAERHVPHAYPPSTQDLANHPRVARGPGW